MKEIVITYFLFILLMLMWIVPKYYERIEQNNFNPRNEMVVGNQYDQLSSDQIEFVTSYDGVVKVENHEGYQLEVTYDRSFNQIKFIKELHDQWPRMDVYSRLTILTFTTNYEEEFGIYIEFEHDLFVFYISILLGGLVIFSLFGIRNNISRKEKNKE